MICLACLMSDMLNDRISNFLGEPSRRLDWWLLGGLSLSIGAGAPLARAVKLWQVMAQ